MQFGVEVPADFRPSDLVGTVIIYQEQIPVGHIKFPSFRRNPPNGLHRHPRPLGEKARRYSKAFTSYALRDRNEVLKRVQMLEAPGIDFFLDVISLKPGQRWKQKLYHHIDDCDVFFLFWSRAARKSKWVLEESRYAIQRQGGDAMVPPSFIPLGLEGPPPPDPPHFLKAIHFNDRILYFMDRPKGRNPFRQLWNCIGRLFRRGIQP